MSGNLRKTLLRRVVR